MTIDHEQKEKENLTTRTIASGSKSQHQLTIASKPTSLEFIEKKETLKESSEETSYLKDQLEPDQRQLQSP